MTKMNHERQVLLNTLALWEHIKEAGFTVEQVRGFSFRPKFLTRDELRTLRRKPHDKSECRTHHNCVVDHDGEPHRIPLIPRPGNVGLFAKW